MQDGYKTFAHSTGIIIVSQNPAISKELCKNKKFYQFTPPPAIALAPEIFISLDLVPEIAAEGLPLPVKKFLLHM